MSQMASNSGNRARSSGYRGKLRRNYYDRLNAYIERRNEAQGFNWGEEVERDANYRKAMDRGARMTPGRMKHNKKRSDGWRNKKQAPPTALRRDEIKPDFIAKKETPGVQKDLYSTGGMTAVTHVTAQFGQNLDFSSFPLFVDSV
ncbi:hypothetical protein KPH14_000988 [Odynerus spinipes]|uniref:Uncharacterized protein n=1 Tax=Odynerus spinipes TaxID=1348599 RepID=A0AAD9RF13_9HYME|nr:hypothetical protein KPH14_000988 [Odynerus spinipes]